MFEPRPEQSLHPCSPSPCRRRGRCLWRSIWCYPPACPARPSLLPCHSPTARKAHAFLGTCQPRPRHPLCRRGGAFGQAPAPAQLELRFGPKEAQLLDCTSRKLLFVKPLRRRSLPAALAALQEAGAVACRLRAVELEEAEEEGGQEQLHVLLDVALLPPFFEAAEGSEVRRQVVV